MGNAGEMWALFDAYVYTVINIDKIFCIKCDYGYLKNKKPF